MPKPPLDTAAERTLASDVQGAPAASSPRIFGAGNSILATPKTESIMTSARCDQYSPVRHLALTFWANRDPARCWMVAYSAFYDASSTEGDLDRPLVVAGLFSTVDRWQRFEREWAEGWLVPSSTLPTFT